MTTARHERWMAVLLVGCVALVVFWEVASRLASRPFDALRLSAEDFAGFQPSDPQWAIRLVHLKATPTEPTVIAYEVRRHVLPSDGVSGDRPYGPILVRLVHGYNMVDCMRIKQYRVDLLADTRNHDEGGTTVAPPVQVWRLTSSTGSRAVWVTTMLRTSDFTATEWDTRDMNFPRVGTPDDPAWAPSGLKWSSFRRPLHNFRMYVRSKWNASRSDLLTFLRLRQPAWASDVLLTMVSEYRGPSVEDRKEAQVVEQMLDAHQLLYRLFVEGAEKRQQNQSSGRALLMDPSAAESFAGKVKK